MDRYRHLIVGLDLAPDGQSASRGSLQAAREAQQLAERTGARVSFLHSTFHESVTFEGDPTHPEDPLAPEAREALESTSREFGGETAKLDVSAEPAWLELIRRVQAGRADLVVVAKRSHGSEDGRRLGTNALKLLRKCPAPVWVVNADRPSLDGCVVAATDLSAVGGRATQLARYFAGAFGQEWHIIHAYQIPMSLQMSGEYTTAEGTPTERRAKLEADLRRRIQEAVANGEPAPKIHVGCDAPTHAIRDALRVLQPSLLVMGTLSRASVAGVLIGNTAERLLSEIDCSMLTIKPDDFESPVR